MAVPRTPFGWQKRQLEPTNWPFNRIRRALVIGALLSAWCPAPNPLPLLWLGLYWLRWAMPSFIRRLARRRIVNRYYLPADVLRVDDAGIWRLRRMFAATLLILALHLPFFAAYAVSYPFLARAARYWLTEAPATSDPLPIPMVYGVMPVLTRNAELRSMTYYLPGGYIVFWVGDDVGADGIKARFGPYVPEHSLFTGL
jgi:hypothetical protein